MSTVAGDGMNRGGHSKASTLGLNEVLTMYRNGAIMSMAAPTLRTISRAVVRVRRRRGGVEAHVRSARFAISVWPTERTSTSTVMMTARAEPYPNSRKLNACLYR